MSDNEDRTPSDERFAGVSRCNDCGHELPSDASYTRCARCSYTRDVEHALTQARAENARLTAALDRVRDDAERLDTVEAWTNGDTTICPPGNHGGELINWLVTQNDEKRGTWEEYEAPTLREAIDAARTQPEGGNG